MLMEMCSDLKGSSDDLVRTLVGDPAWAHFVKALERKQYGHEAIWDAWHWFCHGWDSAVIQEARDRRNE